MLLLTLAGSTTSMSTEVDPSSLVSGSFSYSDLLLLVITGLSVGLSPLTLSLRFWVKAITGSLPPGLVIWAHHYLKTLRLQPKLTLLLHCSMC